MDNLEHRVFAFDKVEADDEKRTITGRAIVYNSLSKPLKTNSGTSFRETILPGALADSVKQNDILALREHNPQLILGRTSAGTLKLEDRDDGMYCSIDVPPTSYGNDTLISAKRGDLKGFSFGFVPTKQRQFTRSGEKIRELSGIDCREVSIVGSPAYDATTMSVRSEDFVEEVTEEQKKKTEEQRSATETRRRKLSLHTHQLRGITSCNNPQTQ